MTAKLSFEEIKTKQQQTWSSGDYAKVAPLTVPLADVLVDAVDLYPGSRVLDVATGTGHVALAAARRFCDTTGVDYVPALLAAARRRAEAEGLAVELREADAEDLPFAEGSFDYVLSAIGVMFTADHQRAADELTRVCKPGGRIGMVNWTPTGFVGQLLKTVSNHAAPPPGALAPTRWGTEGTVRDLFGSRVTELAFSTGRISMRFPSADFFADHFITHYGPTRAAARRLTEEGRHAFRDDLITLGRSANRGVGAAMIADVEYAVIVATKLSTS